MVESWLTLVVIALGALLAVWLCVEIGLRVAVGWRLETDFYGSLSRDDVRERQELHGVCVASGCGWAHLGWVADPERERYRVERLEDAGWEPHAWTRYGSLLVRGAGSYRVWAVPRAAGEPRLVGEVEARPGESDPPLFVPRIVGP